MKRHSLLVLTIAALFWGMGMSHATTTIGQDWTLRNPLATAQNLTAIAVNGTTSIVVVGEYGVILSATSASNWTPSVSPVATALLDVTWADSQAEYVAVGGSGVILTSPDGVTWTRQSAPVATDQFNAVIASPTLLVIVGANAAHQGIVLTSTNGGTSWTRSAAPLTFKVGTKTAAATALLDVTWTGSQFAAVENGAVLTSTDALTWTGVGLSGTTPKSIAYSASKLVVTGNKNWISTNGTTWTAAGAAPLNMVINATPTTIVGVNTTGQIATSADGGVTWATQTSHAIYLASGAQFGTTNVVVGDSGTIQTQPSGGAWTPLTASTFNIAWNGQTGASSLYVAVGSNMSWTSPDASTWTAHPQPAPASMLSIVWSDSAGKFVASGTHVWTSADGITWARVTLGNEAANSPSVYGLGIVFGSQVVALGYDNKIAQSSIASLSPLGAQGTPFQYLPTHWGMLGIASSPGLVVAAGWSGHTLTTTDGVRWTERIVPLASGEDFNDIKYDETLKRFIAVTGRGGIRYSNDGVHWGVAAIWSYNSTTSQWVKGTAASGTLWCVVRTANEFVAAGNGGLLLRSFNGVEWRQFPSISGTHQYINGLLWASDARQLVAVGGLGMMLTSQGDDAVQPEVAFAAATTSVEEWAAPAQIAVTMSQPWDLPVTVLVKATTGTTAVAKSDYAALVTSVTFAPGQTTRNIAFAPYSDFSSEGNRTLVLALSAPSGDVKIGSQATTTLTITDPISNPSDPSYRDTIPTDVLVLAGEPAAFSVASSTGNPAALQWRKDGKSISKATAATFAIPSTTLASAGAYTVATIAPSRTTVSQTAQLGVVDGTPQYITSKAGVKVTLTAFTAGNGLTYQWFKDSTKLDGELGKTLVLPSVSDGSSGVYYCEVNLDLLPTTVRCGDIHFDVVSVAPSISGPTNADAWVSTSFDSLALTPAFLPTATEKVSHWTITPMPPGLTYNSSTGRITGKPTTANLNGYLIYFTATNAAGNSLKNAAFLRIHPLPSPAVGTFRGLVDSSPLVNDGLGGRLDLTTAPTGLFSGKFTDALAAVSVSGVLTGNQDGDPVASFAVGSRQVSVTLDHGTGALSGSVTSGAASTSLTGWRIMAAADTASRAGYYTSAIGSGYGTFTLASTGAFTITGKTADGLAYSCASNLGVGGQMGIYSLFSSSTGSLAGTMTLHEDAAPLGVTKTAANYPANYLTGSLGWTQPTVATLALAADGGRYVMPKAPALVMNLVAGTDNAKLSFTGADLSTDSRDPDGLFTVKSVATVTPPGNLAGTQLAFDIKTGLFSGSFTLVDSGVTRAPTFSGVLIRPGGSAIMTGNGFFTVHELPPGTHMLQGSVTLERP